MATKTTETKKTEEEKKTVLSSLKAKDASLIGQIVAAVWIAVWSAISFIRNGISINEVVKSGIFMAICFCPVYFSILMDKVTGNGKS